MTVSFPKNMVSIGIAVTTMRNAPGGHYFREPSNSNDAACDYRSRTSHTTLLSVTIRPSGVIASTATT